MYNLKRLAKNVRADSVQRNSLYLILNAGIGSIFGFIFWVIVARHYTPSDVGLASVIVSASVMIATISNFGFNIAIIRYLPSAKEKTNKLINSFMTVAGSTSVILSLMFLINVDFISKSLTFLHSSYWYNLSFIVFTFCFLLVLMQDSIFIARRRSEYIILKNLILGTRIIFPVFLLSFGAIGIFVSYGIAYMIVMLISTFFLMPHAIQDYVPKLTVDKLLITEAFHFSIGNYIAGFFEVAPGLLLPIIIANALDPESTAYFYIAWTIASIVYVIPRSIAMSLFAEGSHKGIEFSAELKKSIKLIVILILPAFIAIFVGGDKLLYLFGKDYSLETFELLRILALSTFPLAINVVFIAIWRIEKKVVSIVFINIFIAISTVVVGYFFAPNFGIIGFGMAWFIAQTIVSLTIVSLTIVSLTIGKRSLCDLMKHITN